MPTRRQRVEKALAALDGVIESDSVFSDGNGYWVNGTQVAHFFDDSGLELRLGRKSISAHRAELEADARVELRKSSSDWLIVRVVDATGVTRALDLMQLAVEAHRPPPGAVDRPPPTGADLARRRRFH